WNPTRHEQREGRVDRYGQPRERVRALTYYGTDNRIDEIVLKVLIRKEKAIRNALGISVPVPSGANAVLEAVFEGVIGQAPARGRRGRGAGRPARRAERRAAARPRSRPLRPARAGGRGLPGTHPPADRTAGSVRDGYSARPADREPRGTLRRDPQRRRCAAHD